jgi:hypothetical protein
VIEGLANGDIGFYAKIHHAALDGQGGIAVAQALLDASPRGRTPPGAPRPGQTAPLPDSARMIGAALRNTVAQYGRLVKAVPDALKAVGRAAQCR